jgi:hypothetical protein
MLQLGLLIMMEKRRRNARTGNERYFIHMLVITLFSFVADIMSSFNSVPDWFFPFSVAGVYAEIIFSTALIPIFYRYICTQISGLNASLKRNLYLVLLSLTLLCAATVVSTAFTGQIFYFDSARVYHRGPLLFIPMSMQLIMMLIIEGFLISQRQKNRSELLQVADTLSSCAAYRMGAAAFHIRASVLTAQHYLCVIDPVHEYPEPQ